MTSKVKTIGLLFTTTIQDANSPDFGIGQFELPITIPEGPFLADTDKLNMVKRTIANHLASAVMDTQVPPEMWSVRLTDEFANAFAIPKEFKCRPPK